MTEVILMTQVISMTQIPDALFKKFMNGSDIIIPNGNNMGETYFIFYNKMNLGFTNNGILRHNQIAKIINLKEEVVYTSKNPYIMGYQAGIEQANKIEDPLYLFGYQAGLQMARESNLRFLA